MTINVPPSARRQRSDHENRIKALEARRITGSTTQAQTGGGGTIIQSNGIVFSYPGPLAPGVESPPYYPLAAQTLTALRVSLLVNATANHVVEVRLNGSVIETVTLGTGTKTTTSTISHAVTTSDYLTVKTVTVSDHDLSVELS